jgi:hypothetical protein
VTHVQGESLKVIAADFARLLNSPTTRAPGGRFTRRGVVAMEQPYSQISYSPWADWLSKFHTWPELIQALWLVAVPVTVLGVTWLVMRGLRDTVAAWRTDSRGDAQGRLVYGVIEDADGRLLLWRDGEVRAVETHHTLVPPAPSSPGLSRRSGL